MGRKISLSMLYNIMKNGTTIPGAVSYNGEVYRYDDDTQNYISVDDYKYSLLEDVVNSTMSIPELFEEENIETLHAVRLTDEELSVICPIFDILGVDSCIISKIVHRKVHGNLEMSSIYIYENIENGMILGTITLPSSLFMNIVPDVRYVYQSGLILIQKGDD